jgi:hypothetical protein
MRGGVEIYSLECRRGMSVLKGVGVGSDNRV